MPLGTMSIEKSISLGGGNPGNSLENTSEKSLMVGMSVTLDLPLPYQSHKPSRLHILSTPFFS